MANIFDSYGVKKGLAYRHDYQRDMDRSMQFKQQEQQMIIQQKKEAADLAQRLEKDPNMTAYNSSMLQKRIDSDIIPRMKEFTNTNPFWDRDPTLVMEMNKFKAEILNNDIVATDLQAREQYAALQADDESSPEYVKEKLVEWDRYSRTGSIDENEGTPFTYQKQYHASIGDVAAMYASQVSYNKNVEIRKDGKYLVQEARQESLDEQYLKVTDNLKHYNILKKSFEKYQENSEVTGNPKFAGEKEYFESFIDGKNGEATYFDVTDQQKINLARRNTEGKANNALYTSKFLTAMQSAMASKTGTVTANNNAMKLTSMPVENAIYPSNAINATAQNTDGKWLNLTDAVGDNIKFKAGNAIQYYRNPETGALYVDVSVSVNPPDIETGGDVKGSPYYKLTHDLGFTQDQTIIDSFSMQDQLQKDKGITENDDGYINFEAQSKKIAYQGTLRLKVDPNNLQAFYDYETDGMSIDQKRAFERDKFGYVATVKGLLSTQEVLNEIEKEETEKPYGTARGGLRDQVIQEDLEFFKYNKNKE